MKQAVSVFIALITFCSLAQVDFSKDFTVTAGIPYDVVDANVKHYFPIGDGNAISIKTSETMVTIQKFDVSSLKEEVKHDYIKFPRYFKVQSIIETSEGLFYIYEAYNKAERTFSLYSRKINTANASFENDEMLFTTTMPVVGQPSDAFGRAPMFEEKMKIQSGIKFQVFQSFDKSKVLVQYRVKPIKKSDAKNYDILGFFVYDANMKPRSGSEVKMPYTEKQMDNLAYIVGSNGDVSMLAYLRESKKFELLKITNDGLVEQFPLDIKGGFIFQQFKITEDNEGNLMCAGFYATETYNVRRGYIGQKFDTQGVYCFEMDNEGNIFNESEIRFPSDFIQKYHKENEFKSGKQMAIGFGLEDLKMIEFIQQDDGSSIIIGEQQFIVQKMNYGGTVSGAGAPGGTVRSTSNSTPPVFHFKNIVAIKLDKDGELEWMQNLPKNQTSGGSVSFSPFGSAAAAHDAYWEGQMSVKYVRGKEAHYLLFVDNAKNATLNINEIPEKHMNGYGGYLTTFKISDADGEVERHVIAELANMDNMAAHQFKVTRICDATDNVFLLEIYMKNKKDVMIKMELSE